MLASRRLLVCQGVVALTLLALVSLAAGRPGQSQAPASAKEATPAYQVTLFGILATPKSQVIDPKLAEVEPQLRQILPDFGFKRLGVKSRRLSAGQTIKCDLGEGRKARAELVNPLDADGKVEIKFTLEIPGQTPFSTVIKTPPNQLVFCDRALPNKDQLLIGLAAR